MSEASPEIEDYLLEDRTFPPPRRVQGAVARRRDLPLRRGRPGLRGLLGPAGRRPARLGRRSGTRSSSGSCPSRSGSSAARSTSRRTASTATSRRAGATGSRSTGRASRATPARSPTPTCWPRCSASPTCSRASASQQGRPGRHLHADDPRAAGGAAGLRPHRRRPLGGVRRLLGRLAVRPHQRRRGKVLVTADGGWRRGQAALLKPTADVALADTPSITGVVVVQRTGASGDDAEIAMTEGRDHWYHDLDGRGRRRVPGRADGQRGPAVPALHVGHHGQAQGHHAHDRRLPHPGRVHPQVRLRPPPRDRRVLVRGRHRLGHRPQLHRLRPARQRRHLGDVRGHARHARPATAGGRSSRSTRSRSSTPRRPPSGRS